MHEVILESQVFRHIQFDNDFEFPLEQNVIITNDLSKGKQSYCIEFFEETIPV
jgi:hypothetical protein